MNDKNEIIENFKNEVTDSIKGEVNDNIEKSVKNTTDSLNDKISKTFDAIKSLTETQKSTNEQIASFSKKRSFNIDSSEISVDSDVESQISNKKSFLKNLLNVDEDCRPLNGYFGGKAISGKDIFNDFSLTKSLQKSKSCKSYNTYNNENGGYLMQYPNLIGLRDVNRISIPNLINISSVSSGGSFTNSFITLDPSNLDIEQTQEGTSISNSGKVKNGEVIINAKDYSHFAPITQKMFDANRLGYLVGGDMLDRHLMYIDRILLKKVNNDGIKNLINSADASEIKSEDTLEAGKFTYDDIWNISDKIKNDYLGNATLFILKSAFTELLKDKGGNGQYTAFAGNLPIFDPAGNMVLVGNGCRIKVITVDSFANSGLGDEASDTCAFFGDFQEAYEFVTYDNAESITLLNNKLQSDKIYQLAKTTYFGQGLVNKEALIRIKIKS